MIRDILRMGDPRLYQRAAEVDTFGTTALYALITDMCDTMAAAQGVGLAAPQIGVPVRVVIFGFEDNPRYPTAEAVPFTVLVNPVLEPLGEALEEGFEGCLSVPLLRGSVPRYTRLRYTGLTPEGETIDRVVEGFHARVVQHECDHLDGILYPMRVRDFTRFGFADVLFPEGLTSASDEAGKG